MDVQSKGCRMCLCKCENPRNMLEESEFAEKVMRVFPQIQVCDLSEYAEIDALMF